MEGAKCVPAALRPPHRGGSKALFGRALPPHTPSLYRRYINKHPSYEIACIICALAPAYSSATLSHHTAQTVRNASSHTPQRYHTVLHALKVTLIQLYQPTPQHLLCRYTLFHNPRTHTHALRHYYAPTVSSPRVMPVTVLHVSKPRPYSIPPLHIAQLVMSVPA